MDIQPGKYKASPPGSRCYWSKNSRSGDIIDNELSSGAQLVVIEASVFSFKSSDCGIWTKVG